MCTEWTSCDVHFPDDWMNMVTVQSGQMLKKLIILRHHKLRIWIWTQIKYLLRGRNINLRIKYYTSHMALEYEGSHTHQWTHSWGC